MTEPVTECGNEGYCKLEPRYDEGAPTITASSGNYTADDMVKIINASKPRIYICDVCVECGLVVYPDDRVESTFAPEERDMSRHGGPADPPQATEAIKKRILGSDYWP